LSKFRSVVPRRIIEDVEESHPRVDGALAVLYVAHLIEGKQYVDEVATGSETFVWGEWIGMRGQEFAAARGKLGPLFFTEYLEAVDPSTRFCRGGFIVGVVCDLQRAHGMKIGKGKLPHGRRGLHREDTGRAGRREGYWGVPV